MTGLGGLERVDWNADDRDLVGPIWDVTKIGHCGTIFEIPRRAAINRTNLRIELTRAKKNARFVGEVDELMSKNESNEIQDLSFEEAIASLEHSVRKLEGHSLGLELALAEYAKATSLIAHCQQKLYGAKSSIEQLKSVTESGRTTSENWEDPADEASDVVKEPSAEEPRSKRRRPS